MLKNVTCFDIVAVHTAENEPLKIWVIYLCYAIHPLLLKRWLRKPSAVVLARGHDLWGKCTACSAVSACRSARSRLYEERNPRVLITAAF